MELFQKLYLPQECEYKKLDPVNNKKAVPDFHIIGEKEQRKCEYYRKRLLCSGMFSLLGEKRLLGF